MTDIFVGEYGKNIYVRTGFDISSATGIEIHFSAPSGGTSFVNSASVSILGADVTTTACGIFSANVACVYKVNHASNSASSEFNVAGTWKGWLVVDFGATKRLISDTFDFIASNPG